MFVWLKNVLLPYLSFKLNNKHIIGRYIKKVNISKEIFSKPNGQLPVEINLKLV